MNTYDLTNLLAEKFKNDVGTMFLTEVANSTGGNARRFADAVTIGLWPSKGYCVEGYEIKISKSDLEHELQDITKWEAVGQFCDKWWLVVSDKSFVDLQRLPPAWGVMYPTKSGTLRVLKPATKLEAKPFTKGFFASVLRKGADHSGMIQKLQAERYAGRQEGIEQGKKTASRGLCDCERLKNKIDVFEKASGIELQNYGGDRLGEDFKDFRSGKSSLHSMKLSIKHLARTIQNMNDDLAKLQEYLK